MKFLIVGLGSMGKRRIRNLTYLKAGDLLCFDPREDRRKEAEEKYGVKTFADFDRAMAENPDVLIVSTPPDLHMKYALAAAKAGKHFFCEASVVDDGMDEVMALCRGKKLVAAPSCTMRFHPAVKIIKEQVDKGAVGKILGLTYHSGQYLPDWHPWEDYRKFYVAKRATGACREIVPFELTWLTWVLGGVKTVSCLKGKVGNLEIDIDDVYQLLLGFESGLIGHMLVDVVARVAYRSFRLLGQDGVIEWNYAEKKVRVYTAADKAWKEIPEPAPIVEAGYVTAAENMYIEEMRTLINAVQGKSPWPYRLEDDRATLGILYDAERSAETGKHVAAGKA
jgi:predicted dehydrogenase